ncbi:MAG TPA: DUF4062 domain-containing protein [Saprospiraceae bacterium]|nr:DUF4062 domain-containing protein [Saprospiraceae bacterium]
MEPRNNIKVLVASTVYGYEDQLASIYSQLDTYGYDVLNSHMGTVYAGADKSNLQSCLDAVDECDAFLGIIRPQYGSGVIGERSITHEEILKAIELRKARWFLAHHDVVFTRQLLKNTKIVERHNLKQIQPESIVIQPNSMIDVRCIEIYNAVTLDKVPPKEKIGHWVQEFHDLPEIQRFIDAQFRKASRVINTVKQMSLLQA